MRLSVRAAAKRAGVGQQAINSAMDRWITSRGKRGLRHVEEDSFETESGETRRQRWTTERWIEEWEDRQAEETLGSKPTTKLKPDSRGLLPGKTRDILKQQGYLQR